MTNYRRESGFLKGVPWHPLGHQREGEYLGHVRVNTFGINLEQSRRSKKIFSGENATE